ncbi:unnamed protein product [Hyaloperonospora brassicae]|uniref:DUSP domain-containing protein n=1 Tax=Hyaloperonospora brassicae TaxID=162125 RepID=A0AAV0TL21_HYABA|nr:unnamed protein product [Hyaloperonospora brassicae]
MPTMSSLEHVKVLSENTVLEEGEFWYAIAKPWWEKSQASSSSSPSELPSVQNEPIVDQQLSSTDREMAVLKPKLEEGVDFVFVSEGSWDMLTHELKYDWAIRREVVYQRNRRQLRIDPYPYVFKILFWTCDAAEPKELMDDAGRVVVVIGYRTDTLSRLLSEVWLAAPDEFRQHFPQFLFGIDPTSASRPRSPTTSDVSRVRVCYRKSWTSDSKLAWVPINHMLKRSRAGPKALGLTPRVSKRHARCSEGSKDGQQRNDGKEAGELKLEEDGPDALDDDRNGLTKTMNVKLDDLRLDRRSEVASGGARLHELLVEQKAQAAEGVGWPSQGVELRWRANLSKGDALDVQDTSSCWLEARLRSTKRAKVCVHYRSWESKWDEWIARTSPRLAPPYARVPKWRSSLKPHDLVQVGVQEPRLRHTKWRNATVLEVAPASSDELKKDERSSGDGVGLYVHVQVDSEDVWLPAHDDLLCPANTHNLSSALSQREFGLLLARSAVSVPAPGQVTEEVAVATKEGENKCEQGEVQAKGSNEEGPDGGLMSLESPRASVQLRSPPLVDVAVETTTTTSCSRLRFGTRVGPARDLSDSFRQAQLQGQSSAGRTPARGRGSRHRSPRVFSDNTSPEPVSPASIPQTGQRNTRDLQTLWAQVGSDLRSLQASWAQLGEEVVALMETFENGPD